MTVTMKARTGPEQAQLIVELERQSKSAVDFTIKAQGIYATQDLVDETYLNEAGEERTRLIDGTGVKLSLPVFNQNDELGFSVAKDFGMPVRISTPLNQAAQLQLFEKLGIPARYGQRMRDQSQSLLATNINTWLQHSSNADMRLLIRMLDGKVRAVLSPGYKMLDSYDAAFRLLKKGKDIGAVVQEMTLSDSHFSMTMLQHDWAERVDAADEVLRPGHQVANFDRRMGEQEIEDWILPGLKFSNSETGSGALKVEQYFWRRRCANGLIGSETMRRVHLGSQLPEGIITPEVRKAEAALVWTEVDAMVEAAFDRDKFIAEVKKMRGLTQEKLDDPVGAVEVFVKDNEMSPEDRQAILNELISGGDNTKWGLLNAVTAHARKVGDAGDVDKQEELERRAYVLVNARK